MAKAKKKVAKKVVVKKVEVEESKGLLVVLKNFTLGPKLYKKDQEIEVSKEDIEKLLKLELVKEL